MTEADYLELISMAAGNASQHAMVTVTVLFAYIFAAYLVGPKLSKFQMTAVTTLYSIYFLLPVLATLGEQTRIRQLSEQFGQTFPEQYAYYIGSNGVTPIQYYIYTTILVSAFAWSLSIYFMIDHRKKNLDKNSDN